MKFEAKDLLRCTSEGEGDWSKGYTKLQIKLIAESQGKFVMEQGKFKGTEMRASALPSHEGQKGFYRLNRALDRVMYCEEEGKGKKHREVSRDIKEKVETLR